MCVYIYSLIIIEEKKNNSINVSINNQLIYNSILFFKYLKYIVLCINLDINNVTCSIVKIIHLISKVYNLIWINNKKIDWNNVVNANQNLNFLTPRYLCGQSYNLDRTSLSRVSQARHASNNKFQHMCERERYVLPRWGRKVTHFSFADEDK